MIFEETTLGAFLLVTERLLDSRGFFARSFCQDSCAPTISTLSLRRRTSRSITWPGPCEGSTSSIRRPPRPRSSAAPAARSSTSSSISPAGRPTYLQHVAVLSTRTTASPSTFRSALPTATSTIADATETSYIVGLRTRPEAEGGLAFDDHRLGVKWPLPVSEISEKDLELAAARGVRRRAARSGRQRDLTDNVLAERRGCRRPIRVGIIGARFHHPGLVNPIVNSVAGMRVIGVDPHPARAMDVIR